MEWLCQEAARQSGKCGRVRGDSNSVRIAPIDRTIAASPLARACAPAGA